MISAFVVLIIILACGYAAFWFIDSGMPAPMNVIAKILVAVLGLYAIWMYVLPTVGLR